MRGKLQNLVGKKFVRLLVIQLLPDRAKYGKARWLCLCSCGKTTTATTSDLRSDNTRSCGCLGRELTSNRAKGNKYSAIEEGEASFREAFSAYKRDSKRRGYCFELSSEQVRELMTSNCSYCGLEPQINSGRAKSNGKFIRNGIDRKDNSKGYTIDNVVPCCFICNKAKWTQSIEEFGAWLTRVNNHMVVTQKVIPQVTPSLAKWIITQ